MRNMKLYVLIVALLGLAFNVPMLAQSPFPDVIPLGFRPEGVAITFDTNIYVSSVDDGNIWRGDVRTGTGEFLVNLATPLFGLGLSYDPRTNYLFVAGGFVATVVSNTDLARVYDATTGELIKSFSFPPPTAACPGIDHPWGFHVYHFANDVVVTRDGAYITDSVNPCIYKLPLGPGGRLAENAEEIVLDGGLPGSGSWPDFVPNGIEATPNGKNLLVVDSVGGGLYRIDPTSGGWTEVLGGLFGGDGILLINKTLYVARSMFNNDLVLASGGTPLLKDQITVVELNTQMTTGRITQTIEHDALCRPATIAAFGSYLYVANAAMDGSQGITTALASCHGSGHEIVRIPRHD